MPSYRDSAKAPVPVQGGGLTHGRGSDVDAALCEGWGLPGPAVGVPLRGRPWRQLHPALGRSVEPTGTGYAVLYELVVQAPLVLSQNVLLQRVLGLERMGEGRLVRNVVKKLCRNLGDDAADSRYIVTERWMGYRMPVGEG